MAKATKTASSISQIVDADEKKKALNIFCKLLPVKN